MNADIEGFFSYFPSEYISLAYFDKQSNKILSGCSYIHDRKDKLLHELSGFKDITAHILVNNSDGTGRKKENITACHTFFCDLDRWIDKKELGEILEKYAPHVVTQTSMKEEAGVKFGKFHFYWRCNPSLSLARWSVYQKGINAILKSPEPTPGAITHMLRVPGFERIQKDGQTFTPKLVYLEQSAEPIDVQKTFPGVVRAARQVEKKEERQHKELASIDVSSLTEIDFSEGARNNTMYLALHTLVKRGRVGSITELKNAAKTINESIVPDVGGPLAHDELSSIVKSAWERGSKAFKREQRKLAIAKGEGERMLHDTNGLEAPSTEQITLDKLKDVAKQQVNGKLKEFHYELTGVNIQDPFNTPAIMERFFYRYGHLISITEAKTKGFRVFHPEKKIWVIQENDHFPMLMHYVTEMLKDLVMSEAFILALGSDNNGINIPKLRGNREKYLSIPYRNLLCKAIINSPEVPQLSEFDFDAHPELFFCANGVLNIKTGELREVKATDYLLAKSEVSWDVSADTKEWEGFIENVFKKNTAPEMSCQFIQEIFGYSLSGDMSAQLVFCHFGTAANGKSTLLKILRSIAGEYAMKMAPDALSGKGDNKFERLSVRMIGKRICIIDDIQTNASLEEAFIKNITDTEVEARFLRKEHIPVKNRAKFHLGLNSMPKGKGHSEGYFRRIKAVPYSQKFIPNDENTRYVDTLVERNKSAILKWAIEGYQRYLEQGFFTLPPDSSVIEREYREEAGGITEELIKELFEEAGPGEYITCAEAITILNRALGYEMDSINNTTAGRWFGQVFGVEAEQKKVAGINARIYRIKAKPTVTSL